MYAARQAFRWLLASLVVTTPAAQNEATDTTVIDNVPSVWRRRDSRVPGVWRVGPISRGTPFDARVTGLEVVEAHCSSQLALATNLPRTKLDHPRKVGIAVDSSSVPVGVVEEVRRSDSVWATAEGAVLASFSRLEAAQAATNREQLPRETPVPVTRITALFREAKSPRSPLYFVAEKKYRTSRAAQDPHCGTMTLVTGRLSWVLQEHGYEDETYLIAEVLETAVRYPIEVHGGGC